MSKSVTKLGFTIVELLIVIVVIGILAAITIVAYNGITNRANDTAALSNAQQAGKKITVYALSNSETLPPDLATAGLTDSTATYQYTRNTASNPDTFCVTATNGTTTAHSAGTITSVNPPTAGPCPGHTGTAPTTLASGDTCPTNYIVVPGSSLYGTNAFCVMKYEAKIQGNDIGTTTYASTMVADSRATGTPWVNISQTNAIAEAAALGDGYHLITEAEWLTIAQNVMSVPSNWSGGSVGSGYMYRGHTDGTPANSLAASTDNDGYSGTGQTTAEQRRTLTLTNGEVIWDLAGDVWEWTDGTTQGGNQPGAPGIAWRQWNALSVPGSLSPNPYPSYANSAAGGWNSTQNIGQVYSDSTQTGLRAFLRGGAFYDGSIAGVSALILSFSPGNTHGAVGFRVTR